MATITVTIPDADLTAYQQAYTNIYGTTIQAGIAAQVESVYTANAINQAQANVAPPPAVTAA